MHSPIALQSSQVAPAPPLAPPKPPPAPECERSSLLVSVDGFDTEDDDHRFRWRQFLLQLPLQLGNPFLLPLVALCFSPGAAANVAGWPSPLRVWQAPLLSLVAAMAASPLVALVAWALSPVEADPLLTATLRAEVIQTMVIFFCMRISISIKYAYMRPTVFAKRMSLWASSSDRLQEQLIYGWRQLRPGTIAREVRLAAAKLPGAEAAVFELAPAALPRLRAGFGCEVAVAIIDAALLAAEVAGGGSAGAAPLPLRVPVPAFVEALQAAAQARVAGFVNGSFRLLLLLSVFGSLSNLTWRAVFGIPSFGHVPAQAVVVVCHWVSTALLGAFTWSFMLIGAFDHSRRAKAHELLGKFFSPGVLEGATTPPILRLDSLPQTRAFLAARGVLREFGALYHARLVLVTSVLVAIMTLLAFYCVITMYVTSAGRFELLIPTFSTLHVVALPGFVCCALGLRHAAEANMEAARHVAVVAGTRLAVRMAPGFEEARDATLLQLLADVETALREQHASEPLSVLGLPASRGLAQSFAGFVVSVETVALTVFLSRLTGARTV